MIDGREEKSKKRTVNEEEGAKFLSNGKDTMAMRSRDELKGHS